MRIRDSLSMCPMNEQYDAKNRLPTLHMYNRYEYINTLTQNCQRICLFSLFYHTPKVGVDKNSHTDRMGPKFPTSIVHRKDKIDLMLDNRAGCKRLAP